jgi:hypothetical protein
MLITSLIGARKSDATTAYTKSLSFVAACTIVLLLLLFLFSLRFLAGLGYRPKLGTDLWKVLDFEIR